MTNVTERCHPRPPHLPGLSLLSYLHSRRSFAGLVVILLATLLAPTTFAGAQNTSIDPEQTSAAVPFIGDYEVWCTDRNPAPFNLCRSHHGSPAIDFGMPIGATINATGSGRVIEADSFCSGSGWCNGGAGNMVVIEHPDGTYSRYLHLLAVTMSVGQQVQTGDVVGTNGNTGHSSSPHLHYDEHFPLGTRTEMGSFIGCVDGEQVRYPQAFGTDDWSEVEYGSRMVNDGYSCFDDPVPTSVPRFFPGPSSFAVAPPIGSENALYEIELSQDGLDSPITFRMNATALRRFDSISGITEIRAREIIQGTPQLWSEPAFYDPTQDEIARSCDGLYASQASLTGTPQADVLIGTNLDDVIDGRGGNDIICSLDGDDIIRAGRGLDVVFAGAGDDTISGGFGPDQIYGEDGADNIRGGNGADVIYGQGGDDMLHGTAGNDEVRGGSGNDTVIGGIGHDRTYGEAGNDSLEGRNGRDLLSGGAGVDSYDGGNGTDRCIPDGTANETTLNCER